MTRYWGDWEHAFPPLDHLAQLPGWLLRQHASDMLAYPFGGPHYGSTLTLLCVLAGLVVLFRGRRFFLASLCLVPLAANLAAAAVGAYPYGSQVRTMLYAAPLFCLLAGAGAAALLLRIPTPPNRRHVPVLATVGFLTVLGFAWPSRDFVRPFKMEFCRESRDFARWFWESKSRGAEVECLDIDLGLDFAAGPRDEFGIWSHLFDTSSLYRSNHAIYPPLQPPDRSRVAADHPLRCVFHRSWTYRYDEARLAEWLGNMEKQYRLTGHETHRFPISWLNRNDSYDCVELYEFVPKSS